jgi:glycosyltransferase involved in cell wall biosynthesis
VGTLPTVARATGFTSIAALEGGLPPERARDLLQRMHRLARLVAPAWHLGVRLRRAGLANVEVIPNAVDLRRFTPRRADPELRARLGIAPDDVVVMHVSNLKTIKRPFDLVRSARAALARDPRLRYVIVGDGPERGALEALCRCQRVASRFRFTGWIDYARMPRVIGLADVVVMPSAVEGLARVYLETQACGRVLIASDIPGAREVVRDGETGLLFPTGDVAALTAAILRAAGDARLRRVIGRSARARVAAHDMETVLDAWAELLGRAAGEGAGHGVAGGRSDAPAVGLPGVPSRRPRGSGEPYRAEPLAARRWHGGGGPMRAASAARRG